MVTDAVVGSVTQSEARAVLGRMQRGEATTLKDEAVALGLPTVGPLKAALVEVCGGREAYADVMAERKYPRKTKPPSRQRRRSKEQEAPVVGAGGQQRKKKDPPGMVAVEIDDGTDDDADDDGGGVVLSVPEDAADADSAGDEDEEGVSDVVDLMHGGQGGLRGRG